MNNNNRSNRRRGRGNRPQGQGGGQVNRIDSRARGNAPQMLEKYKKLAQDAQHNGDRVQAEYYLQFADHYYRVMADTRMRQDENRARRGDEGRDPRPGGDRFDADEDDFDTRDDRRDRGRRPSRTEADEPAVPADEPAPGRADDGVFGNGALPSEEGVPGHEGEIAVRPRRGRSDTVRTARPRAGRAGVAPAPGEDDAEQGAVDAAVLQPAFRGVDTEDEGGAEPLPTPRRRRVRAVTQDDGSPVGAVG
ncbi:DUF4167 domain-containing protein [Erythrobacteraceae bacterium CFH 75059]|uniref:DUF4167 domain-containing protein n=1 Tax=Qipengyuania thermophila TaxID=2509361 RepID=UPI00101FB4C4|nr:DUF4167 domain-containing protein [Qipengyuania thermophila]TCD06886.1 DUF4167 domain-containing protein [Erythrobacteraceae bacterium CFH 75059]